MAVAVRAVGATASSAGGANATITLPTHATDDILLIFVENYTDADLTFNQNTAGFAKLTRLYGSAGVARNLAIYWVRATSSSMTSPSVTCSTNHQICTSMSISGCITTGNPWDISATQDISTSTSSFTWPTITTTVANTLIVCAGASTRDNTGQWLSSEANSNLTSVTEQYDDSITTNAGGGLAIWTGLSGSAQAIGSGSATAAASYYGITITISLIPPVVSGSDTNGDFFQFF